MIAAFHVFLFLVSVLFSDPDRYCPVSHRWGKAGVELKSGPWSVTQSGAGCSGESESGGFNEVLRERRKAASRTWLFTLSMKHVFLGGRRSEEKIDDPFPH